MLKIIISFPINSNFIWMLFGLLSCNLFALSRNFISPGRGIQKYICYSHWVWIHTLVKVTVSVRTEIGICTRKILDVEKLLIPIVQVDHGVRFTIPVLVPTRDWDTRDWDMHYLKINFCLKLVPIHLAKSLVGQYVPVLVLIGIGPGICTEIC